MDINTYKRLVWRTSSGRSTKVKCLNCDSIISDGTTYLDLTGLFQGNLRICSHCYLSFLLKTKPEWFTEKCLTDLAGDAI